MSSDNASSSAPKGPTVNDVEDEINDLQLKLQESSLRDAPFTGQQKNPDGGYWQGSNLHLLDIPSTATNASDWQGEKTTLSRGATGLASSKFAIPSRPTVNISGSTAKVTAANPTPQLPAGNEGLITINTPVDSSVHTTDQDEVEQFSIAGSSVSTQRRNVLADAGITEEVRRLIVDDVVARILRPFNAKGGLKEYFVTAMSVNEENIKKWVNEVNEARKQIAERSAEDADTELAKWEERLKLLEEKIDTVIHTAKIDDQTKVALTAEAITIMRENKDYRARVRKALANKEDIETVLAEEFNDDESRAESEKYNNMAAELEMLKNRLAKYEQVEAKSATLRRSPLSQSSTQPSSPEKQKTNVNLLKNLKNL